MKIKILKVPPSKKIATIKVVRQATGLNLLEAKALVDKVPCCEFSVKPGEDLRAARTELDELGVTHAHVHGERLRVKPGWYHCGKKGSRIASDAWVGGQWWTPVLWDEDEDPDWHKASGLEVVT